MENSTQNMIYLQKYLLRTTEIKNLSEISDDVIRDLEEWVQDESVYAILFMKEEITPSEMSEMVEYFEEVVGEQVLRMIIHYVVAIRKDVTTLNRMDEGIRRVICHLLNIYIYAYSSKKLKWDDVLVSAEFFKYNPDLGDEYLYIRTKAEDIKNFFYCQVEQLEEREELRYKMFGLLNEVQHKEYKKIETEQTVKEVERQQKKFESEMEECVEQVGGCDIFEIMAEKETYQLCKKEDELGQYECENVLSDYFNNIKDANFFENMRSVSKYWRQEWRNLRLLKKNLRKLIEKNKCIKHGDRECFICKGDNQKIKTTRYVKRICRLIAGQDLFNDPVVKEENIENLVYVIDKLYPGILRYCYEVHYEGKVYNMCECSQQYRMGISNYYYLSKLCSNKQKYKGREFLWKNINRQTYGLSSSVEKSKFRRNIFMASQGDVEISGEMCPCGKEKIFREYVKSFVLSRTIMGTFLHYGRIQRLKNCQDLQGDALKISVYYDKNDKRYRIYGLNFKKRK